MRTTRFASDTLRKLFRRQTVATLPELKAALGSDVDLTVFRKLREIGYLTSYSHRAMYYTAENLVDFDERGLWSFAEVRFSKDGTLLNTVERFVVHSERGYFARELRPELGVDVKEPLLKLSRDGRVARETLAGLYLHCSPDPARRRQQLLARSLVADEPFGSRDPATPVEDETKAAIILFVSSLNEKQRRLYAGLESLRLGRGGDRRIAEMIGMDEHTVARGRHQLLERDLELDRIRRPGGGRKPVEKERRK